MSEGKFFFIRSQLNDLVLEVANGVAQPGQEVTPQRAHGADNQLWWEDKIKEVIRSHLDDDYVLDIEGGSNTLVINQYSPEEHMQKWRLAGDRIQHTEEDKFLDIAGCNEDEGARVCAWEENGGTNQQWTFEYLPPKMMFIKSKMHGRVLDVRGADPSPGNKAVMWKKQESEPDNQIWYEDKYGFIHSKLNDLVLDSSGNSIALEPYDPDIPGRQWVKTGNRVLNRTDPSMCLDIKGADQSKGAKLCGYEYAGAENQLWKFEYL